MFPLATAGQPAARNLAVPSPGGQEHCSSGVRLPGGSYSPQDASEEERFCSADFYSKAVALCPKLWSTSPAGIVYDISGGRFPNDPAAFESRACQRGGSARRDAASELAIFKLSMNAADTSGTFSPASLLYYHLSRYFETEVNVPVSVSRTVENGTLLRRVIEPGLRQSSGNAGLRMLNAGYRHMREAALGGLGAPGGREMLTEDGKQFRGILVLETGKRYGPEMNGTRNAGWGAGQNRLFQKTAPFLALRQPGSLREAISEGLRQARLDPAMNLALGALVSDQQMVFWMRELSEIVLLDFILGQQDRIGNIDFVEHWYWVQDGKINDRPAAKGPAPAEIANRQPVRIRRTWLNDNDAGVRSSYSDFAQQAHMLDGLAHFSATTYKKLAALNADLAGEGELYHLLASRFGLEPRELGLIVKRTHAAAEALRRACSERRLRFDLEPRRFFADGNATETTMDCGKP